MDDLHRAGVPPIVRTAREPSQPYFEPDTWILEPSAPLASGPDVILNAGAADKDKVETLFLPVEADDDSQDALDVKTEVQDVGIEEDDEVVFVGSDIVTSIIQVSFLHIVHS